MKKADIEQELQSHKWPNQLIEDQIKLNKTTYQNFGDEYKGNKLKNKFRNVTTRKKNRLQQLIIFHLVHMTHYP